MSDYNSSIAQVSSNGKKTEFPSSANDVNLKKGVCNIFLCKLQPINVSQISWSHLDNINNVMHKHLSCQILNSKLQSFGNSILIFGQDAEDLMGHTWVDKIKPLL